MRPQARRFYEFGSFRLDPVERLLSRDGEVVPLTGKVFDLLLHFVQNSGRTLEKEEVMEQVWPGQFVEEGNLTRNVSTLRKALGESPDDHRCIVTIPGRGYRFVAEVREVVPGEGDSNARAAVGARVPEPAGDAVLAAGPAGSRTFAAGANIATGTKGRVRAAFRSLILVLMVLAAAALFYALYIREWRSAPRPTITSLVVLPLENLSGDPGQEYLADGMTDALIGDLAKISALRVISRTSAMHYKGTKKKMPEIAGELGVDAAVEGTVRRTGDRVLIRTQLIHAATDRHLWAESYEYELRDVLELQSEVAQAIAREIRVAVTAQELARLTDVRQIKPEAYDAYLRARYIWNKRTPETLRRAIEHFERAIKLDPNYAQAYAGLADSYTMLADYGAAPPKKAYPKAREAALKALDLDKDLAEAHTSLAWIKAAYEWEFAEAEKEFQRAVALNPKYETAHQWYAEFLSAMGLHDKAIAELKRAQELEPSSLIVNTALAGAYYFARREDQAIAQCQRVMDLDPNFGEVYSWLQRVYENKGMAREALAAHQKLSDLMGWTKYLERLRQAGSVSSMRVYWQKRLSWVIAEPQPFPFWVAECWAQFGDKEQAFTWLEKACQERSYWAIYLKVVPTLDPLRSDARFTHLLRRIGLAT